MGNASAAVPPELGAALRAGAQLQQALELAGRYRPHVAIVDLMIGGWSGLELCTALRRAAPDTKVLLTSGIGEISRPGGRGRRCRLRAEEADSDELLRAIRALHTGDARFPADRVAQRPAGELSRREREVLQLMALGATNREIALRSTGPRHPHAAHIRPRPQAGRRQPRAAPTARSRSGSSHDRAGRGDRGHGHGPDRHRKDGVATSTPRCASMTRWSRGGRRRRGSRQGVTSPRSSARAYDKRQRPCWTRGTRCLRRRRPRTPSLRAAVRDWQADGVPVELAYVHYAENRGPRTARARHRHGGGAQRASRPQSDSDPDRVVEAGGRRAATTTSNATPVPPEGRGWAWGCHSRSCSGRAARRRLNRGPAGRTSGWCD